MYNLLFKLIRIIYYNLLLKLIWLCCVIYYKVRKIVWLFEVISDWELYVIYNVLFLKGKIDI